MRRLLHAAARLYPRAWRDRYGKEPDDLIDDLTPRWRDVFNIVHGALIMHISRPALIPVAVAIGGAVVGVVVSLAIPPMYASSSQVRVQVPGESAQRIRTTLEAAVHDAALDNTLITVRLHDEPGHDTVLLEVSGAADSALSAKQATENALRSIIHANLVAAERRAPNSRGQFRMVAPANLPRAPQRDSARISVVGGGLGLVVGVVVAFVTRRRRREAA